jgi:hypothetical protein
MLAIVFFFANLLTLVFQLEVFICGLVDGAVHRMVNPRIFRSPVDLMD